jgi:hypothetical protein
MNSLRTINLAGFGAASGPQLRTYAKALPGIGLPRSKPSTDTPKPQTPPQRPPERSPNTPPPGTYQRTGRPQALAYQHLMSLPNRPTAGMRSPFADEAMRVDDDWKALYSTVSQRAFDKDVEGILGRSVKEDEVELKEGESFSTTCLYFNHLTCLNLFFCSLDTFRPLRNKPSLPKTRLLQIHPRLCLWPFRLAPRPSRPSHSLWPYHFPALRVISAKQVHRRG